jgi:hypothetical protein
MEANDEEGPLTAGADEPVTDVGGAQGNEFIYSGFDITRTIFTILTFKENTSSDKCYEGVYCILFILSIMDSFIATVLCAFD